MINNIFDPSATTNCGLLHVYSWKILVSKPRVIIWIRQLKRKAAGRESQREVQ